MHRTERRRVAVVGYTPAGLEQAKRFAAETWLEEVRGQVGAVAAGETLRLSFLMAVSPQRNHDTVEGVVALGEREADAGWLPLLRAWCAAETKRLRGRLRPVIERLERAG